MVHPNGINKVESLDPHGHLSYGYGTWSFDKSKQVDKVLDSNIEKVRKREINGWDSAKL